MGKRSYDVALRSLLYCIIRQLLELLPADTQVPKVAKRVLNVVSSTTMPQARKEMIIQKLYDEEFDDSIFD